jgi:hypothetical protein
MADEWIAKPGIVQVVNHYEETRNSPPLLQLFEERFTAYRLDPGLVWIATEDGAVVGYPTERINQVALDEKYEGQASRVELAPAHPIQEGTPLHVVED